MAVAASTAVAKSLATGPQALSAALMQSVFGAGGGHAASTTYTLDATLGQPVVGASASPATGLSAGFWQAGAAGPAGHPVYLPLVRR